MAYARTRRLDPLTGDVAFDRTTGTWDQGEPLAEKVHRCLRTPVGTAARDRSYGVDWSALDNASDNAAELGRQAILTALARFIRRGEILLDPSDVVVEVQGPTVLWAVTFRDPKTARPQTVSDSVRLAA